MAWTATLLKKDAQRDGSLKLVVQYVNGAREINKEYTYFGEFDLGVVVNNEINNFDKLKQNFLSLTENATVIPTSVASGPASVASEAPTPQSQFFVALHKLSSYQNLIDLGVVPNNDSTYLAIKSSVTSGFQSSYI